MSRRQPYTLTFSPPIVDWERPASSVWHTYCVCDCVRDFKYAQVGGCCGRCVLLHLHRHRRIMQPPAGTCANCASSVGVPASCSAPVPPAAVRNPSPSFLAMAGDKPDTQDWTNWNFVFDDLAACERRGRRCNFLWLVALDAPFHPAPLLHTRCTAEIPLLQCSAYQQWY